MDNKNYELINSISAKVKKDSKSFFSSNITIETARAIFKSANYYQKIQNRALADNDHTLPIHHFTALSKTDGEVISYNVKSGRNLNRNEWIKLLICHQVYYLDIDTIKNIMLD